jgi:DNA repair exonuclease SbcCD nuclease subunit
MYFISDLHLCEKKPVARIEKDNDEWWEAQVKTIREIDEIVDGDNLIIAGDVFDKSKVSNYFINRCIDLFKSLKSKVFVTYGNHDLPTHSLERRCESALYTLIRSGAVTQLHDELLDGYRVIGEDFGDDTGICTTDKSIAVVHRYVDNGGSVFATKEEALDNVYKIYEDKGFSFVVSGDNHQHFIKGGLCNCGSPMRYNWSQYEHKPVLVKFDGSFTTIPLFFNKDEVTNSHIDKVRDKMLDDFVDTLVDDFTVGISFPENINIFLRENEVDEKIKEKVLLIVNELK